MSTTSSSRKSNSLKLIAAAATIAVTGAKVYREITRYSLRNKVVLVTGGARGLGLELCRVLGKRGAQLAICSRTEEQLQNARIELQNLGIEVMTRHADVADKDQVREMIDEIIRHYGRLDVLVNNAGIVQVGPALDMSVEDYEKIMKINFFGPLYTTYAALPHFLKQRSGKIVNISSVGGKVAVPHLLPYSASKFALTGFSEGLHAELKKENIDVLTVIPHLMTTGSPRNITVKGDHESEYAWFKIADSSPLLSQEAELSAEKIVKSIEYGDSETALALPAKLASIAEGFAPGWVTALMSVANRLLPDATLSTESKKGFEVESKKSQGRISAYSDRAAVRNNEI